MKIYGVGKTNATKLYDSGMRTLQDIRKHPNLLNSKQLIGLKYVDDLQIKIPRNEITELFNIVKSHLHEIVPKELIEAEPCGSYRRGKELCGDIDILITRNDDDAIEHILEQLLERLHKINFIKETLALTKDLGLSTKSQFMGICRLRNDLPFRRIDIKVYSKDCYAFALLGFTGSAEFNRNLRQKAKELGYSLSDDGLTQLSTGKKITCLTEKEIMQALGENYIPPTKRDI